MKNRRSEITSALGQIPIEPMLNSGTWEVKTMDDGWTVITVDGKDSAHFEYTIAVLEDEVEILTPFE